METNIIKNFVSKIIKEHLLKEKIYYHTSVHGIENISQGALINELGIHLGTKETVEKIQKLKGGLIKKYKVKLENPLRVHDFARWEAFVVSKSLFNKGIITELEYKKINEKTGNDKDKELIKILKQKGYDGFIYENYFEGGGESVVVFDISQLEEIKN